VSHPIRDPEVQANVERMSAVLEPWRTGKLVVEFNLKDGRWTPGNVSVTFPRRHHE
jgi:hypothetical protein